MRSERIMKNFHRPARVIEPKPSAHIVLIDSGSINRLVMQIAPSLPSHFSSPPSFVGMFDSEKNLWLVIFCPHNIGSKGAFRWELHKMVITCEWVSVCLAKRKSVRVLFFLSARDVVCLAHTWSFVWLIVCCFHPSMALALCHHPAPPPRSGRFSSLDSRECIYLVPTSRHSRKTKRVLFDRALNFGVQVFGFAFYDSFPLAFCLVGSAVGLAGWYRANVDFFLLGL